MCLSWESVIEVLRQRKEETGSTSEGLAKKHKTQNSPEKGGDKGFPASPAPVRTRDSIRTGA